MHAPFPTKGQSALAAGLHPSSFRLLAPADAHAGAVCSRPLALEVPFVNRARAKSRLVLSEEVGKRADIILIRGNDINIAPVADVEASVVQSATPANVDTVLVDGRIVKRGGKLVAYDVDKIVRDAKASALRIRTAAGGRLTPPASR